MNDQFTISIGFGVQMREKLSERKARSERGNEGERQRERGGVWERDQETERETDGGVVTWT
jgi:hypothetical protein